MGQVASIFSDAALGEVASAGEHGTFRQRGGRTESARVLVKSFLKLILDSYIPLKRSQTREFRAVQKSRILHTSEMGGKQLVRS
jgi:hypothetical protein